MDCVVVMLGVLKISQPNKNVECGRVECRLVVADGSFLLVIIDLLDRYQTTRYE